MSYRHIITFIWLLFFSLPVWSDQLIVEPDMGRAPILQAISQAQSNINLTMYGFTDQHVLQALLTQQTNGKNIKVILERKPYKMEDENQKVILAFKKNHIPWQGKISPFRLIHQKTLLIDNRLALVLTFNLTHSSFKKKIRNFGLIINDPARVAAVQAIFNADWNHRQAVPHPDVIFSPNDSRQQLIALIKQAQHSIKIYAQTVNDFHIIGELATAAHNKIVVRILTSNPLSSKQSNYLQQAGIKIHYNKKIYIHAKAFIVDDKKVLIGSINLTKASLDNNRELSIISRDKEVIQKMNQYFQKDWGDGIASQETNSKGDWLTQLNGYVIWVKKLF